MQDFQNRVINELNELNTRINALSSFIGGKIFLSLPQEDQDLLSAQLPVMQELSRILTLRVARF